ncbi:MAG: tRNA uridine-5-carboxymethylaminomethyl(34) synthesis GTPase MnmE [Clostridiales Family XIII bacterium]|jgi:tRNA modification GTPase|nr:tRNA uridine-5-carboxymethylaminomethyl(34) synthesis GTPase MnmE [Clostridiales Family XIII bacterium]
MSETIAAISSAPGEGAIGVVRISGDRAKEILGRLFCPAGSDFEERKFYYGTIQEPSSNCVIDEVLAVYMAAPRTYTREDVAEIYCHGSYLSVKRILEAVLFCGAVPAEPGEFTKRAFLNGRIDLAQADAVIDVIRARTDLAHTAAVGQLGGRLSERIRAIRSVLADALAETVVHLDYPDEDEDPASDNSAAVRIAKMLEGAAEEIRELVETAEAGRMVCDGLNVVIAGKPNVGKSSLLNALLRETRAIVSDVPGTTRDRIEEYANVHGIPVKFVDTAGIRDAEGEVEQIGIDMALDATRDADIILFLVDGSGGIDDYDKKVAARLGGKTAVTLVSKSDAYQVINLTDAEALIPGSPVMSVSSVSGAGIAELEKHIAELVFGGEISPGERLLVTNARHKNLLVRALAETEKAAGELRSGAPLDFAEVEMRAAYDSLGEIIGETVTDDILDRVFERFCVGK